MCDNKNNIKKTAISCIKNTIDFFKNNPDFISKVQDAWLENKRLSAQIKELEFQNNRTLSEITKKYELMKDILILVFGERQKALNSHYVILEKALSSDDRELVIASLKGISSIVTQNPLESFSEFSEIWDNKDETLYLDF